MAHGERWRGRIEAQVAELGTFRTWVIDNLYTLGHARQEQRLREEAIKIGARDLDRRLADVDRLIADLDRRIDEVREHTLTREVYDERHDLLVAQVNVISEWKANITGRIVGVGVIVVLFTATVTAVITHLVG